MGVRPTEGDENSSKGCLYMLRKNALYEGHGFSRAVNVLLGWQL
jgi:hypothetical protein